jgi:hypothetical protein
MLTKLTRTILAHDTELKVRHLHLTVPDSARSPALFLSLQKTWESLTPMGRMGEPEDLSVRTLSVARD